MDEDKFQDDIRTYRERSWLQFRSKPYFHVYVLLAVSYLLILVFIIVGLSKVTSLSSELSEMNAEIPKRPSGLDDQLFPCGPDTRQWEYFNEKCYYFSLETAPWTRAKTRCEEKQSQLVIVNSMAEQNFLQSRTRNERYWMGLTDMDAEGVWRWLDGSDYTRGFQHWKAGEPNDDARNEDCAHLWGNGEWNDVYCTYLCYYICEKPLPGAATAHHRGA
ncbi:hepatic lectin-like [Eublepharis macularius]|uniref:Hepatic lectin-like n=1 Tax=Eublepharis macularius TaxID=481883 RepID=A0AA97LJY1_EUBMA|nr:hepatic lectin-like [Eublepharis macularius]